MHGRSVEKQDCAQCDLSDLLTRLATSDPDFALFCATQEFREKNAPPPGLLEDVLILLRSDPSTAATIETLEAAPSAVRRFPLGETVPLALVVLFVLRSHVKIRRYRDGTWNFRLDSKPTDSDILLSILKKIEDWVKGTGV